MHRTAGHALNGLPGWSGLTLEEEPGDTGEGGAGDAVDTADSAGSPESFTRDQLLSMKPIDLITDESLKSDPTLANISDLDTMARMLHSAQKMVGNPKNYIKRLSENATDEERAAFYRELGAPESPDEYRAPEFERPEDMPPMSQERLGQFMQVFHKANMTQEQIDLVLSEYNNLEVGVWAQSTEQTQQAFDAATEQLKQVWGQAYEEKLGEAQAAVEALSKPDVLGEDFKVWLERKNLDNDPIQIRLLSMLAGNMQDPALPRGGTSSGSGRLTPAAALERIAELKADPNFVKRWTNERDAGHQQAQDEITRLYAIAYPGKGAAA